MKYGHCVVRPQYNAPSDQLGQTFLINWLTKLFTLHMGRSEGKKIKIKVKFLFLFRKGSVNGDRLEVGGEGKKHLGR